MRWNFSVLGNRNLSKGFLPTFISCPMECKQYLYFSIHPLKGGNLQLSKVIILRTSLVSSKIVGWAIEVLPTNCVQASIDTSKWLFKQKVEVFWPFISFIYFLYGRNCEVQWQLFFCLAWKTRDRFVLNLFMETNISNMKNGNRIFKQGICISYSFSLRGRNIICLVGKGTVTFYTLSSSKGYDLLVSLIFTRTNCYIMAQGVLDSFGGLFLIIMSYLSDYCGMVEKSIGIGRRYLLTSGFKCLRTGGIFSQPQFPYQEN